MQTCETLETIFTHLHTECQARDLHNRCGLQSPQVKSGHLRVLESQINFILVYGFMVRLFISPFSCTEISNKVKHVRKWKYRPRDLPCVLIGWDIFNNRAYKKHIQTILPHVPICPVCLDHLDKHPNPLATPQPSPGQKFRQKTRIIKSIRIKVLQKFAKTMLFFCNS